MNIAFLDLIKWDYNIETVYQKPLGGSQSALCYLAEELAKLGHKVFLFNQISQSIISRGVFCYRRVANPANLEIWRSLDVLIIVNLAGRAKSIKQFLGDQTKLILWEHQAANSEHSQELADKEERDLYDKFVFVSEWQCQEYCQKFDLDRARCQVMRNAIAPNFLNLFPDDQILIHKAQPPVIAYTSTPYRGLDLLLSVFPKIQQAIPNIKLKVFSSLKVYYYNEQADYAKFGELYSLCKKMPGVEYMGSVTQAQLAEEMRSIALLAYPNTFAETSCIAALEAMASGCEIVSSKLAALPETTAGFAKLISVDDVANFVSETEWQCADRWDWQPYKNRFTNAIIESLEMWINTNHNPQLRQAQENHLKEQLNYVKKFYSWPKRALEWLNFLQEITSMSNLTDYLPEQSNFQLEPENLGSQPTVDIEYGLQPDPFNLTDNNVRVDPLTYNLSDQDKNDQFLPENKPINIVDIDPIFADVESYKKQAELYLSQGNFPRAIEACQEALKIRPDFALIYMTLGNILQAQGKINAAIRAYNHTLKLHPEYAEVYANIGSMYFKLNQLDQAILYYEKALQIKPSLVEVYSNLGRAYQSQGNNKSAIDAWQKAGVLQPNLADAKLYFDLGNKLIKDGQIEEAITNYQQAINLQPTWAEAYANMAVGYAKLRNFQDSYKCYQKAIELNPNLQGIHYNMASLCMQNGRYGEAVNYYQITIEKQPDFAEAYGNLGSAYSQLGEINKAKESYEKALEIKPDFAEIYCRLGHLQKLEEPLTAIKNFEKSIEINPDYFEAHQQLCDLLSHSNNLSGARKASDRYYATCSDRALIMSATSYVFAYLQSGVCEEALLKVREIEAICHQTQCLNFTRMELKLLYEIFLFSISHLRDELEGNADFYRVVAKAYYNNGIKPNPPLRKYAHKTLRIGFLSKHFRRHSVGWCSEAVIRELTYLTPDVHLYVTGQIKSDEITQRFERMALNLHWPKSYPNGFASAAEIVEQVRQDEIDILIDLDSTTVPVNVEILQHYPAQICMTWLGFDAPYISEQHYFLCDGWSHPEGREKYYTEKLVRLSSGSVAITPLNSRPIDRNGVRQMLGIRPDQVAYLCVAPGRKSNRETVRAQISILRQVPDSVLIRKGQGDPDIIHQLYREECEIQGVDFERIKFLGATKTEEEHRSVYHLGDVVLDSYPYNGGTHNLEALSANVPVVTRVGDQYLSRMGYSFLKSVNLDVGIAWNWEQYTQWGIKLGLDADLRYTVRQHLIKSKQPDFLAPLWNPRRLAQEMYETFGQLLKG